MKVTRYTTANYARLAEERKKQAEQAKARTAPEQEAAAPARPATQSRATDTGTDEATDPIAGSDEPDPQEVEEVATALANHPEGAGRSMDDLRKWARNTLREVAYCHRLGGQLSPNAAKFAAWLEIPKPKPAQQRPEGMTSGGEMASAIGWKYLAFNQAVTQGTIPAPAVRHDNGNMYWNKADADRIIARHRRN